MAYIVDTLPTLEKLGVSESSLQNIDPYKIASEWFARFSKHATAGNVEGVVTLLVENALWRDVLSMTWDFRTFQGRVLQNFLVDRLAATQMSSFKLNDQYIGLQRPYADLVWIEAMFNFESNVGLCSGVFRLVPQKSGSWKAHCIFTTLEDLKGFPEKIGPLRNTTPNHGKWEEERRQATSFASHDPTVLIVGGGQSGLELAARLKALDIPSLVLEKNPRVGDNWRNRYEALCLHDPVWYDHMPYLSFPPSWPVYTPAKKLANWLEFYAEALELPVWTSAEVKSATTDDSGMWRVTVGRGAEQDRVFTVKHLVFATGFGSYRGRLPSYPGMDDFKGQILHSSQHHKATDHAGKKVVVIGACTSAHDICADYYEHGVDVTMFQRSSTYVMTTTNGWRILFKGLYSETAPPVDIADRLNASYPNALVGLLAPRKTLELADADKELLDGLRSVGFRLNLGYKDAGFSLAVWENAGGYYLDVGTSQMIVDGKIKLKNDSQITRFTASGLTFENGSELAADVVVFATGVGDVRDNIRKVCGDNIADKCKPIWGLDAEGEIQGCWRDLGIPGLWYMMGNLAYCRFHSKHVALQIKAMEEKIFGPRYSLD